MKFSCKARKLISRISKSNKKEKSTLTSLTNFNLESLVTTVQLLVRIKIEMKVMQSQVLYQPSVGLVLELKK